MSKSKVYLSLDDLHKLYGISPEVIKQIKKKRRKRKKRKQLKDNKLASENKSTNEQMKGYSMSKSNALEEMKIESHLKSIDNQNKRFEQEVKPDILEPDEISFLQQMKNEIKTGDIKINKTKTGLSFLKPSLKQPRYKKSSQVEEIFEETFMKSTQKINSLANQGSSSMTREDPNNIYVFKFQDDNFDAPTTKGSDYFLGSPDDTIYPIIENESSVLLGDKPVAQDVIDEPFVEDDEKQNVEEEYVEEEDLVDPIVYTPKKVNEYSLNKLKQIAKENKIKFKNFSKQELYNELYQLQLL